MGYPEQYSRQGAHFVAILDNWVGSGWRSSQSAQGGRQLEISRTACFPRLLPGITLATAECFSLMPL